GTSWRAALRARRRGGQQFILTWGGRVSSKRRAAPAAGAVAPCGDNPALSALAPRGYYRRPHGGLDPTPDPAAVARRTPSGRGSPGAADTAGAARVDDAVGVRRR